MSAREDGGAAFPYSALEPDLETRQLVGSIYADSRGMTLRDYFAAKAMQGLLASPRAPGDGDENPVTTESIARLSYLMADAMLAARKN